MVWTVRGTYPFVERQSETKEEVKELIPIKNTFIQSTNFIKEYVVDCIL